MKYKVGDKVKLVSERPSGWNSYGKMDKYLGQIVTISKIKDDYRFEIEEDDRDECWDKWTFRFENIVEELERKEEFNMNYDEIVKLYKERMATKYRKEKEELENKINDDYDLLVDDYNNKLLKLLKKENREQDFYLYKIGCKPFSVVKRKEVDNVEKEYDVLFEELDKTLAEVSAQLKLCTTRDEVNEVLKTYKILNKDGKINA